MGFYIQISSLYHRFISIGISEGMPFSEKIRVELSNLFSLIAIPGCFIHLLYNLFGPDIEREYYLTFLWMMILSSALLLNHYKRYSIAKIISVLPVLVIVVLIHIQFGWEMRLEPMYLMLILVFGYLFNQKTAILFMILIVAAYISVALQLSFFPVNRSADILPTAPFIYFGYASIVTILLTCRVIAENRRFNELTIQQNKILKEKNEELERFTYIASHDLQSPLRNVIGFSGLIENALQKEEYDEIEEFLPFIKSNASQMSLLIKDILEFSKINYKEAENRTSVDLKEVLVKVNRALQQDIEKKGVDVSSDDLPVYYCNETEIGLVFQNIIQNGIKYNDRSDPKIKVWSSYDENELKIHFQDNGIGIEEKYYEKIFEFFKRLHTVDKYEGTGIGLGLCKKIIQSYEGRIEVSSELGEGSVFTIILPIKNLIPHSALLKTALPDF